MKEEWRDIPDYEGYYQVSDLGNVRGVDRVIQMINGGERKVKSKILSKYIHLGYPTANLWKDNKGKVFFIHQLVAMAFLGHKPCGYELVVNHINFKRDDNRLENLELVTVRENTNQKHLPSVSKHVGVTWRKDRGVWLSSIRVGVKIIRLGSFENELDAAKAYNYALELLENGEDVMKAIKKKTVAPYRVSVNFRKSLDKWVVTSSINGVRKYLGCFNNEHDANKWRDKALDAISKNKSAPVKRPKSTSIFKGVSLNRRTSKWVSQIKPPNSKHKYIGSYNTELEAHHAYQKYLREHVFIEGKE